MQISLKFSLNPPQLEVLAFALLSFSVLAIDQNCRPPAERKAEVSPADFPRPKVANWGGGGRVLGMR